MGGQYRDGDAGGDRGTARQTAGSGAQGSRGQEGAAGRGCGCEGRRGTSVQKKGSAARSVVLQVGRPGVPTLGRVYLVRLILLQVLRLWPTWKPPQQLPRTNACPVWAHEE